MAKAGVLSLSLLLLLLLVEINILDGPWMAGAGPIDKIDCPSKCAYRCSKSGRPKMCLRACNACCQRCDCVPPGTYGNKEVCPCYANMKTHGGRPKCP